MSIRIEFLASCSRLSQSLVTLTSLAKLFINPEFCQCPLRRSYQLQLFWYLQQTACFAASACNGACYHAFNVIECTHYITRITLNVSQTGCTIAFQLGFKPSLLVWLTGSLPIKPSQPTGILNMLRCVHTDKNLVVRLGTTWLCDIKCVVIVWTVGATCVVRHFRLCDQDREPPNVGPLQKKFVWHNGLTKMLCAVWRNLNIFSSFFTGHAQIIFGFFFWNLFMLGYTVYFAFNRSRLYCLLLYLFLIMSDAEES